MADLESVLPSVQTDFPHTISAGLLGDYQSYPRVIYNAFYLRIHLHIDRNCDEKPFLIVNDNLISPSLLNNVRCIFLHEVESLFMHYSGKIL